MYVSMASSIGIFLLFLLGDPKSLDVGMVNGLNFFTAAYIALYVIKGSFNAMSGGLVIPMTADCADYEVYRTGKYVPGLMGTLFSFVDKLISSLAGTFVSLMIAAIGFTTTQPTQDTPYSAGIFWVTMACFIGAPMVGWICNLVAMHFYPLSCAILWIFPGRRPACICLRMRPRKRTKLFTNASRKRSQTATRWMNTTTKCSAA